MLFQYQSRLIQTEGIIGQLAMTTLDPQLEQYYYNIGNSCDMRFRKMLNFDNFLRQSGCDQIRLNWAKSGLMSLMYNKAASNGAPLIWMYDAKSKELKNALASLEPYLSCIPLKEQVAMAKSIAARFAGLDIPMPIVNAFKKADTQPNPERIHYLAVLHLLNNTLVLIDRPKYSRAKATEITGYESAFVTRSSEIVRSMAAAGAFSLNPDVNMRMQESAAVVAKFEDAINGSASDVWGKKTDSCLQKGTLPVAKITAKIVDGGQCLYELTIPASGLELTNGVFEYIPMRLMYQYCEGMINKLIEMNTAKIMCSSPSVGSYVNKITVIPNTFVSLYSSCTDKERVAKRAQLPVGYTLRRCELLTLNLESSIYSSKGYCGINPYRIINIESLPVDEINTFAHDLPPQSITAVFQRKLKGASQSVLVNIINSIPDMKRLYSDDKVTDDSVITCSCNVHYSQLLEYMLSHPQLYPNCISEIKAVGARPELRDVLLQGTDEDRVAQLLELMKSHVVCINYVSTDGAGELFTTSNPDLLREKFGDTYEMQFESWGVKANALKQYILSYGLHQAQLVDTLIKRYNIKYLDASKIVSFDEAGLTAWIEAADVQRPKRKTTPNPLVVLCRNYNALSAADYWRNINIKNITSTAIVK